MGIYSALILVLTFCLVSKNSHTGAWEPEGENRTHFGWSY